MHRRCSPYFLKPTPTGFVGLHSQQTNGTLKQKIVAESVLSGLNGYKNRPNKGVQGTLHKVSGPLTPDVLHKMMRTIFKISIAAIGLICSNLASFAQSTNEQIDAQCGEVIKGMVQDIASIKTNYAELANFDPANPVVFGNVIPKESQHQNLRVSYFNNYEYVEPAQGRKGHYRLNPGGCILKIQLFPDGGSWAGFLIDENIRNIDVRSETGVQLQASIQTPNKELSDRIEQIVRSRFKALDEK